MNETEQAVVRWLRREAAMRFRLADEGPPGSNYNFTRAIAVKMAADAIERGEHEETEV